MSNTTTEYWDIDGVSLNNYGWNIESWGGGRRGVPPLRGTDDLIPFRAGQRWLPKVADARTLTLGMWLRGCDEDGVVPVSLRGKLNENLEVLKKLLWQPRRQFTLTRRLARADGTILLHRALGQYAAGLEPESQMTGLGKFTVDIRLADPYFRPDTALTPTVTTAGATITNPGEDIVPDMTLTFSGGGPYVLTNTTTGLALTVNQTGTIVVDTANYTAVKTGVNQVLNVSTNQIGGSLDWMHLLSGANVMTLSSGSCAFSYKPVYT